MSGAQNSDKQVLDNKVAAAQQFTTSLDTPQEVTAYSGSAAITLAKNWLATVTDNPESLAAAKAAVDDVVRSIVIAATPVVDPPGSSPLTFTLTTAPDTFTGAGTNDKFVAAAGTLNSGDNLNGGGGYDVLRVTATGETMAGTLTSIEEIRLIDGGTFNAQATQLSTIAFGHDNQAATGDVTLAIDLGAATAVDLSDVTAGLAGTGAAGIKAIYSNVGTTALDVVLSGLADTFTGTAGNDTIKGGAGGDNIDAGDGDDTFVDFEGEDTLDGGAGTNTLKLTATSADLNSAIDAQLISVHKIDATSSAAGVSISLALQSEGFIITGSSHGDTIRGGAGDDAISGGAGDDTFLEFIGGDAIDGGAGMNTLKISGTTADLNAATDAQLLDIGYVDASTASAGVTIMLSSQTESITLTGSANSDTLKGGSGADMISGGGDSDVIYAGTGGDTLTGGDDDDVFAFTSRNDSAAKIEDFSALDKIRLEGGDFAAIDSAHIKNISGSGAYNAGDGYGFDGGVNLLHYTDTTTGKHSLILDENGNDTSGGYLVLVDDFNYGMIGWSLIELV